MGKTKKIDVKKEAKRGLSERIGHLLSSSDIAIERGTEFGFTEGTIVAHLNDVDVQIKLITPKSGLTRYEKIADEEISTGEIL